jgi:cytochrome P450
MVKYLADNPSAQKKLRDELRAGYSSAWAEKRQPTPDEITKTHIPYLDACIEETNRKSSTAVGVVRKSLVDATVLGHVIPKGIDVFLLNNGGDSLTPPSDVKIPENLRSESSRAAATARTKVGSWDPADVHEFKPERWLHEEDGKVVFNSQAGPMLVFGLGPRGCFGRRLAYLELRQVMVLLVWNFEFQSLPAHLSSYACVDKLTHQAAQAYVRLASAM